MDTDSKLISLNNVSKSFGETRAVADLSLAVDRGEVVGFLGPNGAGKTTTVRMIAGYLAPDAGEIYVNGLEVAEQSLNAKRHIGYLPENNPLYPEMIVRDYLTMIAELRGIPRKARRKRFDQVIKGTGIGEVFFRPIGELSKGFRQRVGLAQAILHKPDILILDEPTEGLDPNQRVEIRQLIERFGKRATVLVCTHVLQEAQAICSRVVIIDEGRLIADDTLDNIAAKARPSRRIVVEVEGKGAAKAIAALKGVLAVEKEEGRKRRQRLVVVSEPKVDLRGDIFSLAKEKDWMLIELHEIKQSLESAFRILTSGKKNVSKDLDSSEEGA